MQHFVAERCRADERQAQDVDAQVGHCGHAETGLQRARDHAEFRERVIADPPAVELDVVIQRIEIVLCEIANFGMKPGPQSDRIGALLCEPALLHFVRACQQIDAVGREGKVECCAIAVRVIRLGDQTARGRGRAVPRAIRVSGDS